MTLHYRKTGEGRPVVILHGLFGSSDNWQSFALKLAGNNFSVFTVDLRNHGRSPHFPVHHYQAMADDVMHFISSVVKAPVALMGHSMGGKAAMQSAFQHPDWIDSLIVMDIAPAAGPVLHAGIIDALKSIDLNTLTSRNQAEQWLAEKIKSREIRQFLLKGLYRTGENRFDWRFNLAILEKELNQIGKAVVSDTPFSKPVLFIRGEKSDYITEDHLELIKKLFSNAQILTAPGAGHWIHADNPQWLLNTVVGFLK